MVKRLATFIAGIISLLTASAQLAPGEWKLYPNFEGFIDFKINYSFDEYYTRIIEIPNQKVYMLSGFNLHSYDKDTNELYSYTSYNELSDFRIVNLFYNYEKNYLTICYANCNIDLLYDDGKIVNLPEIKDYNTTTTKKINDIQFANNRMYIATSFGLVIYDDQKYQVVESGIYNTDISAAFPVDNKLYLLYKASSNKELYVSSLDDRHNTLDKFVKVDNSIVNLTNFVKLGENVFMGIYTDNKIYVFTIDALTDSRTLTYTNQTAYGYFIGNTSTGASVVNTDGQYVLFDKNGNVTDKVVLPESLRKNTAVGWNGLNSVWIARYEGISNYDLSGSVPTQLISNFAPEGFHCTAPAYMFPSQIPGAFYVSNLGISDYNTAGCLTGYADWYPQTTDFVNGDQITDVSCLDATIDFWYGTTYQDWYKDKRLYGGPGGFAEDPDDPTVTYTASQFEGIYKVQDNKQIGLYDWTNSPFTTQDGWNSRVYDVKIDPEGNLWVGFWCNFESDNFGPYAVLPAEKRQLDTSQITKDDWKLSTWHNANDATADRGRYEMKSIFHSNGELMLCVDDGYQSGVTFYNHKGTYANMTDDKAVNHSSFIDQDGNTFTATAFTFLVEDKKGQVWVGTSSGLFVIENPMDAFEESFTVRRPKVARNDGTDYADYLVSSEKVYCIAVDPSNRKWITTEASGVYLVSEDGAEIIEHFDNTNSPLTSNAVYSAFADPTSNRVWFGSKEGIFCYSGTSSPAKDDYSEVYAYPNPVRPDYTGWITVTGLMDGSYVKIADVAGNVFFNGKSEGGMVIWDGCNSAGERVKTGIYFVFASENASGGSSAVVTKIMVIK